MRITMIATRSKQAGWIINAIREEYPETQLIVSSCLRYGSSSLGNLWFGLRHISVFFALMRILGVHKTKYDNVAFMSRDINKDIDKISEFAPDLICSVYCNHWIGPEVTGLARYGGLNVHPALLPKYRGVFPYFWAMLYGEEYAGVTVHRIVPRYDAGDIIKQEKVKISPDDSLMSLNSRCSKVAVRLYLEAIRDIELGIDKWTSQDLSAGAYFSWFSTIDHLKLWWRGLRRRATR